MVVQVVTEQGLQQIVRFRSINGSAGLESVRPSGKRVRGHTWLRSRRTSEVYSSDSSSTCPPCVRQRPRARRDGPSRALLVCRRRRRRRRPGRPHPWRAGAWAAPRGRPHPRLPARARQVGGDGLFQEVLNGALAVRRAGGAAGAAAERLRLGHIPAGSTDAVACSLHGTRSAATAALHIALGDRRAPLPRRPGPAPRVLSTSRACRCAACSSCSRAVTEQAAGRAAAARSAERTACSTARAPAPARAAPAGAKQKQLHPVPALCATVLHVQPHTSAFAPRAASSRRARGAPAAHAEPGAAACSSHDALPTLTAAAQDGAGRDARGHRGRRAPLRGLRGLLWLHGRPHGAQRAAALAGPRALRAGRRAHAAARPRVRRGRLCAARDADAVRAAGPGYWPGVSRGPGDRCQRRHAARRATARRPRRVRAAGSANARCSVPDVQTESCALVRAGRRACCWHLRQRAGPSPAPRVARGGCEGRCEGGARAALGVLQQGRPHPCSHAPEQRAGSAGRARRWSAGRRARCAAPPPARRRRRPRPTSARARTARWARAPGARFRAASRA